MPAIKALVEQAFANDCARFGDQLIETISKQRAEIARQLGELHALEAELDKLEEHVNHCCDGCSADEMAANCGFCGLISQEKGGENDGANG